VGVKISIKNTEKRNYLAPFEKIVITGIGERARCKVSKRKNWKDPFEGCVINVNYYFALAAIKIPVFLDI